MPDSERIPFWEASFAAAHKIERFMAYNSKCLLCLQNYLNFKNFFALILFIAFDLHLSAQDIALKINLRGVYESNISLLPFNVTNGVKPIAEVSGIKNGGTATINISKEKLPAEFVLRFQYKEKETSTPYPSEKQIIIYNQNIELWVNPKYCNNNDSTYYQKDEKENTLFVQFKKGNARQRGNIALLQNLLMNYDSTKSKFYKSGIEEYERRRNEYNRWIIEQSTKYNALFVSHTFRLQYPVSYTHLRRRRCW